MSLSLTELIEKITAFNGLIADSKGRMSGDFQRFLREFLDESNTQVGAASSAAETAQNAADTAQSAANTAQTAAATAQTAADNAAQSSAFLEFPNGKNVTWTDAGAGFPVGNPTRDFIVTARDNAAGQVATMTVRGTLTTATGLIALTVQSESADTGYSIDESFVGSGTASAVATITVTLPDSSKLMGTLSWASKDISVGGELINY